MFSFRPTLWTQLTGRADLSDHSYANLTVFDRMQDEILLLVSLRPEDGLVSWNDWTAESGWGHEMVFPMALPRESNRIQLTSTPLGCRLRVNGQLVFTSSRRFRKLREAYYATCAGGIAAEQIEIQARLPGHGRVRPRLHLLPGFRIEAIAGSQDDLAGAHLHVEGLAAQPLSYVPEMPRLLDWRGKSRNHGVLRMELPGRVWHGGRESLVVSLRDASTTQASAEPLQFDRARACAEIEEQARRGNMRRHVQDATLAIEHCHFGGLLGALSKTARAFVVDAAQLLQAGELSPVDVSAGSAVALRPESVAEAFEVEALSCRDHELAEAFDAKLARTHLEQEDWIGVYLDVAGVFWDRGVFQDLFDSFQRRGPDLLQYVHLHRDAALSALPFLYRFGLFDEICDILDREGATYPAPEQEQGIVHLVHLFLEDRDDTGARRSHADLPLRITAALLKRAEQDFVPGLGTPDAAARLIVARHQIADALYQTVCIDLARAFALVPAFWPAFSSLQQDAQDRVPGRVRAVLTAGTRFLATQGQDGGSVLESCRAARVRALREDYAAPGQHETDWWAVQEAALRSAAAPGAPAPDAGRPAEALRAQISGRYPGMARAPHAILQADATRRAERLVRGALHGEDVTEQACGALLDDLACLAGADSYWIGLGLALDIAHALASSHPAAARLFGQGAMEQLDRTAPETRGEIGAHVRQRRSQSPALVSALSRIARDHAARPDPLFADLLARFSDVTRYDLPSQPETDTALTGLFDTIVVLISCQPNLDTRVARIRDSWLGTLQRYDIPYIVVVGGGDGRREGDVVYLDAPDDYEGLPHKTLKAVEWVATQTGYGHMLKIDDDCFLGVDTFFFSQSHRKFDYYGRRLARDVGGIDRAWHHAKSRTERGRYELDRSPEPSSYAEGGSGYTLSRRAMLALVGNSRTAQGRGLIRRSFMEDKLVGDLLALSAIELSSEDCFVSTLRRVTPRSQPVSLWQNGVFPSQSSPVKLVHLDSLEGFDAADAIVDTARLYPPKIWPRKQRATFGFGTNMLEYLGSQAQIERFRDAPIAVAGVMCDAGPMAELFLAHYRSLGVQGFAVIDSLSKDGTREFLAEQEDVALFSVDTPAVLGRHGSLWLQTVVDHFRVERWTLLVDAHEQVLPGLPDGGLEAIMDAVTPAGADAIRAWLVDLYPAGENVAGPVSGTDLLEQTGYCDRRPVTPDGYSALRRRLPHAKSLHDLAAQKIALVRYRPWMNFQRGLQSLPGAVLADTSLLLGHYGVFAAKRAAFDPSVSVPWLSSDLPKHGEGRGNRTFARSLDPLNAVRGDRDTGDNV